MTSRTESSGSGAIAQEKVGHQTPAMATRKGPPMGRSNIFGTKEWCPQGQYRATLAGTIGG